MALTHVEQVIFNELRTIHPKAKWKDVMEWRSGRNSTKVEDGETQVFLKSLGVTVSVRLQKPKGKK